MFFYHAIPPIRKCNLNAEQYETPDPSSKSGRSVRTIGYSPTAGVLLNVFNVSEGGITYGVNGWRSNTTDIKRYKEESP